MHNEFTAIIEQDEEWFIACCSEIPGANGQGRTIEECRQSLAEAIALVLEDRREDTLRGVPQDAKTPRKSRETLRPSLSQSPVDGKIWTGLSLRFLLA
jgi:predicted RNase H-like HicB family nuclease